MMLAIKASIGGSRTGPASATRRHGSKPTRTEGRGNLSGLVAGVDDWLWQAFLLVSIMQVGPLIAPPASPWLPRRAHLRAECEPAHES